MTKRLTDSQVNRRVNKVIQLTRGEARPRQWREINRLKGINLISLYNMVAERKSPNGFGFMGHGSWDKYLERVHGLVPLDQKQWGDERFHFTIARAIAAHPPEKVGWHGAKRTVFAGKSLATWQQIARNSNLSHRAIIKPKFFGHNSWHAYVAWVKETHKK